MPSDIDAEARARFAEEYPAVSHELDRGQALSAEVGVYRDGWVNGFERAAQIRAATIAERDAEIARLRAENDRLRRHVEFTFGMLTVGRLALRGVPLEHAGRCIYLLRDDVEEFEKAQTKNESALSGAGKAEPYECAECGSRERNHGCRLT